MGMFDNFAPSEKIICPKCKKEIENEDPDLPYKCILQSKELMCLLNLYKQGEPLEIKTIESNFFIKDGWIEAHATCDKCNSYVRYKLITEDGIWTRVEEWKE